MEAIIDNQQLRYALECILQPFQAVVIRQIYRPHIAPPFSFISLSQRDRWPVARLHGSLPLRHPPEPCPWPVTVVSALGLWLQGSIIVLTGGHGRSGAALILRPGNHRSSSIFFRGVLAYQPPGLSQTECIHPALFTYQGSLIWHISQQNLLREGALLDDIGWSSGPFPYILGALDQATRPRPAFELK